ncbi:ricin-type beta-trefoil lectin domain protein [Streptomyces sp. NPDC005009]
MSPPRAPCTVPPVPAVILSLTAAPGLGAPAFRHVFDHGVSPTTLVREETPPPRGPPRDGSGTRLADCSSAWTQQWTYEDDGLLRSVADPGLCLDSHKDAGVVVLGTCADPGDQRGADVRYDLTARGELVPRWDVQLALAPATPDANADIVVKVRDRTVDQRWAAEPVRTDGDSLSINGIGTPSARRAGLAEPVT